MSEGLAVTGLTVGYRVGRGTILNALDDVSFAVPGGHRLAIVGESGSGKSTLGLALMGLLPSNATVAAREVRLGDAALDLGDQRAMASMRGRLMSMVFQDAKSSLDPVRTVGYQIAESLKAHKVVGRKEIWPRVEELLTEVEIPQPAVRARQYPHELSGGMRQRAMIATALASHPRVLIADEPTSALDVTTQATVIDLVHRLADTADMTTLLITHDLALVAGFAESVLVLYAGKVVEFARVEDIFRRPAHPYTQALLASIPSLHAKKQRLLGSIPGRLPDLTQPSPGCIFEPRCPKGHGVEVCQTVAPPAVSLPGGGLSLCHFAGGEQRSTVAGGEQRSTVAGGEQRSTVAGGEQRSTVAEVAGPNPEQRGDASEPEKFDGADDRTTVDTTVPILELRSIEKTFASKSVLRRRSSRIRAVGGADLTIGPGESVGIVGESGSGKTTLARIIVGLERADSGTMLIRGDTSTSDASTRNDAGQQVPVQRLPRDYAQMVFQDPGDSLNPQMTVGEVISEPLVLRDGGRARRYREQVARLLDDVGLRPDMAARRPAELSGGQRQRVAIARALSTQPKLIIADEAVASLDMSARGQILNLLTRLQQEHGFAYLYISHDLSMVRHICDRVVVMYAGRIVETASSDDLFANPRHPYTQALISSVPVPFPQAERERPRILLRGDLPDNRDESVGCQFRFRCYLAQPRCAADRPELLDARPDEPTGHAAACHFAADAEQNFAGALARGGG